MSNKVMSSHLVFDANRIGEQTKKYQMKLKYRNSIINIHTKVF